MKAAAQMAAARLKVTSYASAPPEFVAEARRSDPFKEGLPRMTLAEIAAEIAEVAESGIRGAADSLAQGIGKVDLASLDPGRKRGPRPLGNKIEIKRPAERGGE